MSILLKHLEHFSKIETPFYFYDLRILQKNLDSITKAGRGYHLHYALKANANQPILTRIANAGLGADCVSGNEVRCALDSGFDSNSVVFAGVGKSDKDIEFALRKNIFCFNAESVQELEVINQIAGKLKQKARIALRINPNVKADTHHYISTGLEENKFGINEADLPAVCEVLKKSEYLVLEGLHFHIGSQITTLDPFKSLCMRVNEYYRWFKLKGYNLSFLNVGGGLGTDYKNPDGVGFPDYPSYFEVFRRFLQIPEGVALHFEPGRSIVAQCGSLISKVLFVKPGTFARFVILDAGMTELIRPALYQAYHKIENLSGFQGKLKGGERRFRRILPYNVVGPVCESSDCFGKHVLLPETLRGDIFAIRSTGAYGEVMASNYNQRDKIRAVYDSELETIPF